jgi:hypothetical protein
MEATMKRMLTTLAAIALAFGAASAQAAFHLFRIDQVYSNADGSVQYVVMREATGTDGENFWAGNSLRSTAGANTQTLVFPTNLPSVSTASRSVLIATSGFAALGLVAPDYTIPAQFIPIGGGTLNYASGTDQITLPALPTDGVHAVDRNGTPVAATPRNFAGATTTLTASSRPDLDQHGLTGSWFEPATDGQGIELELFPNSVAPGTALAQGAWFTFEGAPAGGADRQRWLTFSGNAQSGAASVPVTIYRNVGGNFNAPPITNGMPVGTGTLAFTDCNNATLDYAFTDGSGRAGSIPLTRLTMNVTCVSGGTPPTNADFALSGNWYDAATSGQGFVFEVNPQSRALFLTWYTYAPGGQGAGVSGQRWFTALGNFNPGMRTVPLTLHETTGGVFDQPTNPAPASPPVGSVTVTFASCTSASLQFSFNAASNAGRSGTIALTRIGRVPPGCVDTMAGSTMPGTCSMGPCGEGCPP